MHCTHSEGAASYISVLLWLAALLALTVANRRPFRSAKAPAGKTG